MDVAVPFDNRLAAFEVAAAEKKNKYEELRSWLVAQHGCTVTVVPFIVGALGSWRERHHCGVERYSYRAPVWGATG